MQTMARMEKKREKRVRRYNDGLRSARGLKYQPRHDQDVIDTDVTCTRDFDRYIYFPRDGREKNKTKQKSIHLFSLFFTTPENKGVRRGGAFETQQVSQSTVMVISSVDKPIKLEEQKFTPQLLQLLSNRKQNTIQKQQRERNECFFFLLLPPVFLLYTILSTLLLVTILPILRSSATVILILCEETG